MAPRAQRAYRACLYCRQRKSKCEFDTSIPAWSEKNPQCQRCSREGRRCVLAPKRRSERLSDSFPGERHDSVASESSPSPSQAGLGGPGAIDDGVRSVHEQSFSIPQRARTASILDRDLSPTDRTIVDGDLQNPGDALNLLARVANDRDADLENSEAVRHDARGLENGLPASEDEHWHGQDPVDEVMSGDSDAILPHLGITLSTARELLIRYRENYHPFLPIANDDVLDIHKVLEMTRQERHLQTAILTIASKHDEKHRDAHQKCLESMTNLIASTVFHGPTGVEAVEAFLLLAEWAPPHQQWQSNVGAGEEDRASWMQVGLAVRLAYLQGLDASSFETPSKNETQASKRRRIAWAACYMSDRLISTRIGKAFWSRGPGPSSTMGFEDYGPFKLRDLGDNDYSLIFQANLDLTQLFSNAHDILYASLPHRDRLFKTGEYAKYIDDFRNVLANWHAKWSSLNCSANIKCSLLLSYEYLRLYITAFAFQATLSRIPSARSMGSAPPASSRTSFLAKSIAGTGDARFIYEAISAAKSLLSTFNSFVHPKECLRFMPIRYYLYVIYAAVFLYKAKATGVLHPDFNDTELENTIYQTITRLKDSSIESKDPGNRYAKLLALLWGTRMSGCATASSDRPNGQHNLSPDNRRTAAQVAATENHGWTGDHSLMQAHHGPPKTLDETNVPRQHDQPMWDGVIGDTLTSNAFSWRDLESVGQYATSRIEQAGTFAWPELLETAEWNDLNGLGNSSSLFPDVDPWGATHAAF